MSGRDDLAAALGGPVLEVAPRLLGAVLRRDEVAVRITEVEAYDGADDPGSHAFRGRTPRNEVMFGPAGHLYVYFSYGMHHCCNVVTGTEGRAGAVLLRAGEVVTGHEAARSRRGSARDRDLARGPARLCQALGITRADNGTDLSRGPVLLEPADAPVSARAVSTGPRVGLRGAPDRPWRFWITGAATVSTYRPAKPLERRQGPI
jgi:DNA-3-methyladenine glycosylase